MSGMGEVSPLLPLGYALELSTKNGKLEKLF